MLCDVVCVYRENREIAMEIASLKALHLQFTTKIKKLERVLAGVERDLLDQPEIQEAILPLHNAGGTKTIDGVRVELRRTQYWNQELLTEICDGIERPHWPHFITEVTTLKVDNREWLKWAAANPKRADVFTPAYGLKVSEPRVKEVKEDEDD